VLTVAIEMLNPRSKLSHHQQQNDLGQSYAQGQDAQGSYIDDDNNNYGEVSIKRREASNISSSGEKYGNTLDIGGDLIKIHKAGRTTLGKYTKKLARTNPATAMDVGSLLTAASLPPDLIERSTIDNTSTNRPPIRRRFHPINNTLSNDYVVDESKSKIQKVERFRDPVRSTSNDSVENCSLLTSALAFLTQPSQTSPGESLDIVATSSSSAASVADLYSTIPCEAPVVGLYCELECQDTSIWCIGLFPSFHATPPFFYCYYYYHYYYVCANRSPCIYIYVYTIYLPYICTHNNAYSTFILSKRYHA
jgi:hypothetical protein